MRPETVPLTKKQRFLLEMSEAKFRDIVVRPLLKRQGLKDGRDLCGPDEEGKDAAFISINPLGLQELWVVQTKRGRLNMSRDVSKNVIEAETQLRTALSTRLTLQAQKLSLAPSKVILCASGAINKSAREYLAKELHDARLLFLDSDDLIPRIDEVYPELWLGIDPDIYPYLRAVKKQIEASSDTMAVVDILPGALVSPAASAEYFVPLRLYRMVTKTKRKGRRVISVPEVEEIPLDGVLKRRANRRVLILGDAGTGKSTALKRLAYTLAEGSLHQEKKHSFPIMLRCTMLALDPNQSLISLAEEETRRLSGGAKPAFTVEDLEDGRVIMLIDALDEVSTETSRVTVLEKLNTFHALYPICPIVVTARDGTSIRAMPQAVGYLKYSVSSISYKQASQIISYIKKGTTLPIESSQEVLRRLQQVHGIDLNPLLVTVFAATSEYCGRDVPANITELFKKYTEMMLGRWDKSKGLSQQYHAPMKDILLRQVAMRMHQRKVVRLARDEFEQLVGEELARRGREEEAKGIVAELLERSGLFRVDAAGVEFRHLLLQEFFAGRALGGELRGVVTDPWWRRALVFYFGDHPDEGEVFDELMNWIEEQDVARRFEAALTVGVGIQACYFVETGVKRRVLERIIRIMSAARTELIETTDWLKQKRLIGAVMYYLSGRESVAIGLNEEERRRLIEEWDDHEGDQRIRDAERFWRIVALQEMGAVEESVELLRGFDPTERELLLGIFLGCVHIRELRVASKHERDAARMAGDRLSKRLTGLIDELLQEVNSTVLEMREGELAAIEPGDEGASNTSKRVALEG